MASQSLYRKYRPQHFAELVGQEHVTTALRNAVKEGRTGHAYLFSGPRGTGKTTTARLLARALNCLNLGDDGEPCGICENCVAVAAGTFYDLVELDAASNNGVEAVRDLIQSVHLGVGATSRRKVYIIDEVHMLSAAASNTLLKTLEEPPGHVVFVLATTDPQKVLPTIRSRTQHFEFTLLSREQLVAHLADILSREKVEADTEALDLVAGRAAGSVRDALSALDQALAVGGGEIHTEQVQAAFGGAPFEQRITLLESAAGEDVAGVLVAVHEMLTGGHDPRRIADDLLRTLRDAFLLANAGTRIPYDGPGDEAARLSALAQTMGNASLVRAIEVLGEAIVDIRGQAIADPRLVLEVALVRITKRESRTREETLLDRIERIERQLAGGAVPSATPAQPQAAPSDTAEPSASSPSGSRAPIAARPRRANSTPSPDQPGPKASDAADDPQAPAPLTGGVFTLDDVIEAWPATLTALKAPLRAAIQDAQPLDLEGGAVVFGVPRKRFEAINDRFRKEADAIKEAFAGQIGAAPRFIMRPHDFDAPGAFRPAHGDALTAVDDVPSVSLEHDDDVDLSELVDAHDAPPPDSVARLVADLGAEIVEERPRD